MENILVVYTVRKENLRCFNNTLMFYLLQHQLYIYWNIGPWAFQNITKIRRPKGIYAKKQDKQFQSNAILVLYIVLKHEKQPKQLNRK